MSILRSQEGITLFIVLWVLTLLAVIVGEFCYAMRTEVNITRNFKEETESYYRAQAGVYRAISELIKADMLPEDPETEEVEDETGKIDWRVGVDIPQVAFAGGLYKVEIGNESGRVDINTAVDSLLLVALNGLGIEEDERDVIVDSILDWRDTDDMHRLNGAESDYYQSLEKPYNSKNGNFDSIEELLLVRGITQEIFYGGLKDRVTVHGAGDQKKTSRNWRVTRTRSSKININAATPQMLLSLPMMTEDLVNAVLAARQTAVIESVSELVEIVGMDVYTAMRSYITLSGTAFYTIRSTGMPKKGLTRKGIEAVVEINGIYGKGYRILEWKEDMAAFEEGQGKAGPGEAPKGE